MLRNLLHLNLKSPANFVCIASLTGVEHIVHIVGHTRLWPVKKSKCYLLSITFYITALCLLHYPVCRLASTIPPPPLPQPQLVNYCIQEISIHTRTVYCFLITPSMPLLLVFFCICYRMNNI